MLGMFLSDNVSSENSGKLGQMHCVRSAESCGVTGCQPLHCFPMAPTAVWNHLNCSGLGTYSLFSPLHWDVNPIGLEPCSEPC